MSVTIKSYPDNQINEIFTTDATLNSYELLSYVWVDVSAATTDTYIEVVYNGVTKTYYIQDECRYTPIDIFFINKEGSQQSLTFFKARVDEMTVTDNFYESDTGQPSLGFHQNKRYNVNAKSSFRVNTGYVSEETNDAFKQLLLSDRVWMYDGVNFIPLNIKTKSIEYKTRQKDRLINYEISFDYAFNEINNV